MSHSHQGLQLLNPMLGASSCDVKILKYNPSVYWPLNETIGSDALDLVNGWDASYSGASVGAGTGPDGQPCPFFDGVNDCVVCQTAELIAAWDGDEICILAWAKAYNAGVWTDGTARQVWRARSQDYTHVQYLRKASTNNDFQYAHKIDGVGLLHVKGSLSTTDWFHIGVKATGGSAEAYWNGAPLGAATAHDLWIDELYGAWIGAAEPGNEHWFGWIGRFALWFGSVPSDAAIADMATV